MAFDRGVFLGALEDLSKEVTTTFDMYHPAMSEVIEKKQLVKAAGPERTWIVNPDGPGRMLSMLYGDEEIPVGRRDNEVKCSEISGKAVYSFTIEENEVELLNSTQDVVQLLKRKVVDGVTDFKQKVAMQFVMGGVPELVALPTLNPQRTYQPQAHAAVRGGLLAFGAPDTQTGLLHGVARNSVLRWHNQYENITSFRNNGLSRFRRLHRTIAQQGAKQGKGARITLIDNATFDNYMEFNDDRTIYTEKPKTDGTPTEAFRSGIMIVGNGTRLYADPFIDTSAMTGAAQNGLGYALDLDTWEFFTHAGTMDGIDVTKGWFEVEKPEKVPRQLAYVQYIKLRFGVSCLNPRLNGTITGGALV